MPEHLSDCARALVLLTEALALLDGMSETLVAARLSQLIDVLRGHYDGGLASRPHFS